MHTLSIKRTLAIEKIYKVNILVVFSKISRIKFSVILLKMQFYVTFELFRKYSPSVKNIFLSVSAILIIS